MSSTENLGFGSETQEDILEWVGEHYSLEVQNECRRILGERGEKREFSAEVLDEALYCIHQQDVDDAVCLGAEGFSSD